MIWRTIGRSVEPVFAASPKQRGGDDEKAIIVPTELINAISDLPNVVEEVASTWFTDEAVKQELFSGIRERLNANLIAASGGNLNGPEGFNRQTKGPRKSDITNPA